MDISTVASSGALKVFSSVVGATSGAVSGTAADLWGGVIGDRIKQWRLRRFVNSLEKTATFLVEKGVDLNSLQPLPFGESLAIFEGMAKADHQEISIMWARLLAAALDQKAPSSVSTKAIASILEQMSSDAARVFRHLCYIEQENQYCADRLNAQSVRLSRDNETTEAARDQLISKHETARQEREKDWLTLSAEGNYNSARDELLRLNLISADYTLPKFEKDAFKRGYNLNAAGIDSVLNDMQKTFEDALIAASNRNQRPFVEVQNGRSFTQFRLNDFGKSIAEKLCLVQRP